LPTNFHGDSPQIPCKQEERYKEATKKKNNEEVFPISIAIEIQIMSPSTSSSSKANGVEKGKTSVPFRYTASAAFIDTLIAAGVKYLFVNLGTDHPGLVEVFAHASLTKRKDFPRVLTCPNEMVALTVAHSYAQITGECQAVLLHVETGTLAMAGALHNAAKARAPVLIWAGASPSTIEGEMLGGRTEFIQFQQE
jgi:hypothetical protein